MFKARYKSHHDVGGIVSKLAKPERATKDDYLNVLNSKNKSKQLGLYFHTPYCDKICSFCNLNRKRLENDLEEYTEYICQEIEKNAKYEFCKTSEIDVVFFGGGTPTVYNTKQLERILNTLRENFKFAKEYEMTFETTLHNLSISKLKILEKYGVNRISIGIQTFSDRGRKVLNRTYDKNYTIKRIKQLKEYFSGSICIDIIYNYSNQSDEEIIQDAQILSELDIASSSFYSLMIHDGSKMSNDIKEDASTFQYSLERDEHIHNLFYDKCVENGYKLLELTKLTNGKDNYMYIRNNNSSKNLLPLGLGAGGHIEDIGCYNFNKEMSFYSKTTELSKRLSMISGMMQFDKFKIEDLKKYSMEYFDDVMEQFKKYEEEGYFKIDNKYISYERKGIFWGNTISAAIIEEVFKNL